MKTTRKTTSKKGKTYYYEFKEGSWIRTTSQHYERQQYVVRNGRVNKRRLGTFLKGNQSLSWESEVLAQVNRASQKGKSYTLNQIIGMAQHNQIAITLSNVGLTSAEIAQQLGVTEDALLDPHNWNPKENGKPSSIFTDPLSGVSYELKINYEGESYFEKVEA